MKTNRSYLSLIFAGILACTRPSQSSSSPSVPVVDRGDGTIPTLRATQVPAGSIHVDGHLDEASWAHAGSTAALVNPGDGHAAPDSHVQGHARIAWDAQYLYAGIVVDDRDPSSPFQPTDVDPHIWERSSAIELMIQPGDAGDNRNYYEIQVDVHGAIWDTHFDDYNQPITDGPTPGSRLFGHQEWSSAIRQAVVIDQNPGRYTIELAVPWTSFQSDRTAVPPHANDAWRINVYSFRDGQRDSLAWSPLMGQGNFHRAARFGRVVFAN